MDRGDEKTRHRGIFVLRVLFWVVFSWVPLLPSSTVFAARPLTTDDAWTVEKGEFQVEMGADVLRQDNHDREIIPSLTLSYGILDRLDMGVGGSYLWIRPSEGANRDGIGDMDVKTKYRLLDEKGWFPAFTLSGRLKVPTASRSKDLGSGKADWGLSTLFTKNLSKRWALHLNLGYTFIGENGTSDEFQASGALQWILSDQWALSGEVVGVNNFNGRKSDDPVSGLFGTTRMITDKIAWDAGIEFGMNRSAPDFRITTGLTLLFKP